MNKEELMVSVITQMLAPKLYTLSGDNPAEMGFPFADSKELFDERMARQFDTVAFWTEQAQEIATAIIDVIYHDGKPPTVTDEIVERSAGYALKWQPV